MCLVFRKTSFLGFQDAVPSSFGDTAAALALMSLYPDAWAVSHVADERTGERYVQIFER